jgi:glycerol-3-phosphate O-acyltransferase
LIEQLQANGAPVYVTTKSRVETILNALDMLKIRRLVVESDGIYKAVPGEDDILTYYANSIAHWRPYVVRN